MIAARLLWGYHFGIDCCKYGKQWVITKEAMIREYGEPEQVNSANDDFSWEGMCAAEVAQKYGKTVKGLNRRSNGNCPSHQSVQSQQIQIVRTELSVFLRNLLLGQNHFRRYQST